MRAVFVAALLVLATAAFALKVTNTPAARVFHFSDFHYDPFSGTPKAVGPCKNASVGPYGLPGCDSSLTIIQDALRDAASTARQLGGPHVMLYTGDWMRHGMDSLDNSSAVGVQIISTLANEVMKTFGEAGVTNVVHIAHPTIPVAVGNEDFIPDYAFNVSNAGRDPLLRSIANAFKAQGLMGHDEAEQFAYCGFNRREVNLSGVAPLRVLSINTLIWSKQMSPQTAETDPCGQFAWMRKELADAAANGAMVYVQSHILPGIAFWHDHFYTQYFNIMTTYASTVQAQFYGHIHRFAFGAMAKDNSVPPLFVGGPITRVSKTNPDYGIVEVASNWAVTDIQQRYLDLDQKTWVNGLRAKAALNLTDLSTSSLYAVATRMMNSQNAADVAIFANFFQMYNGGPPIANTCTTELLCQKALACLLRSFTPLDSVECALSPTELEAYLEI